jgi:ABC-type uncharacterized transport system substrate-binding protein
MQNRIPYIAAGRAVVVTGALMSVEPGTLLHAPIRVAAEYVDKILKGAKPGDLAMRGPSGTLITLNEKTAGAIGVTFPSSVVANGGRATAGARGASWVLLRSRACLQWLIEPGGSSACREPQPQ